MKFRNKRTSKIQSAHPGEIPREDFLPDCGLTVSSFSKAFGVSRQTVNELVRERRAVTLEMALRLSRLFGNSAEFWLNAQRAVDLWEAAKSVKSDLKHISPLDVA
jgi:antitoxin HigA-1